ncbi:MAG: tetratricopeptide repeat protein, partial [Phaeodactylibacter sp.]|nr:tetratricopeptide repeat protein [Phaeodactylibacter sp.]
MRQITIWYRKPYSWFLMLLCFGSGSPAMAQSAATDSLELLLQSPVDTIRQDALLHLGQKLRHTTPERSMELLETCFAESEVLGLYNRQQKAATSMGISYGMRGDFTTAVQQFNRALEIAIAIGNKVGEASNYTNIGIVYKSLGDYPTSLEYYTKAMQVNHETKDSSGLASCYSNLGILYDLLGDVEQSMHYYEQS